MALGTMRPAPPTWLPRGPVTVFIPFGKLRLERSGKVTHCHSQASRVSRSHSQAPGSGRGTLQKTARDPTEGLILPGPLGKVSCPTPPLPPQPASGMYPHPLSAGTWRADPYPSLRPQH